jgi:hypothetical protein
MATPTQTYTGVRLQLSVTPGSDTFDTVGKLTIPVMPAVTREAIDATTTEDSHRQYFASDLTMYEPSEFTILYDPLDAAHARVRDNIKASNGYKQAYTWRMIDGQGNRMFQCEGFVTTIQPEYAQDAADTITFTVQWTGEATFYAQKEPQS